MDADTLTALQESIAHWRDNASAKTVGEVSLGVDSCALCRIFYDNDCDGCPVRERTGNPECEGSPYWSASHEYWRWKNGYTMGESFRRHAQAELYFLKSLLPEWS